MPHKLIPLSSLQETTTNPRRNADQSPIDGLAESIRTDGVLQNLIVQPAGDGAYRVVTGTRRLRALLYLREQGEIDDGYKVPVEIRTDLDEERTLRIATVENVQREALDPIDEAEAFAALLQNGASIEDVAAQTGVSSSTVRRRVALASLCEEAKVAVRSRDIPLSVAEALTLGSTDEQHGVLGMLDQGADLDADDVRRYLVDGKPTIAAAIFPMDRYTGTLTGDLFAEAETTYLDDVEQFFSLQKEAVEQLAEEHRAKVAWVEVLCLHYVPWWQYREAEEGQPGGVVINLSPTGSVEVREGLARHEVREEVVEETRSPEPQTRERPAYNRPTLRYIGAHKSVAVMAALLGDHRKAKEVAAVVLLSQREFGNPVRTIPHPALAYFAEEEAYPRGVALVEETARKLGGKLGFTDVAKGNSPWAGLTATGEPLAVYDGVRKLSAKDLDRLVTFLLVHTFGQRDLEALDTGDGLFNQIARDLGVSMRTWWAPDDAFLSGLRRSELDQAAIDSGASIRIGRLASLRKSDLVRTLARYFERTADPEAELDEHDQKGREWLPRAMRFPAEVPQPTDTEV